MRTLKLFEDEKIVDEIEVPESFGVVRSIGGSVECWNPYMEYMRYSDKFVMRQEYQERAVQLVQRYSDRLRYVKSYRIAFEVDENWELKENTTPNSRVKVNIVRATRFFAFGDCYDYTIQFKNYYLEKWSSAQINAAIMSQLLRINNPDGCILRNQDDAANPLVATFGAGYLEPGTVIPDLLRDEIQIKEFRRADGQMTIDELEEGSEEKCCDVCGMCIYWKEDHAGMGICHADSMGGMLADTHPACEAFDIGIPVQEEAGSVIDEAGEGDGHDDAA